MPASLAAVPEISIKKDSQEELPDSSPVILPHDPRTFFQGGLFFLAFFTALYFARAIVMPMVLAFVLKLTLQPLLRSLQKWHVHRTVASVLILLILASAIVGMGAALSGPATVWAEKLSDGIPKIQERLGFLKRPIAETQKFMAHAEDMAKINNAKVMPVAVEGTRLSDRIFAGTGALAGGLFTTMLILFFLMISGDTFLRRLVEVLPKFKDKRQAVDISQQIEQDISAYLLTITMMNALVGIATGLVAAVTGLGDAILWGTMVFLLNYIPIVGPLIGMTILLLAGIMANIDGMALFPACLYLVIHIIEGSFVTPFLLAKRFTLNPVLVILSLVFWYWMWGVAGAILSMPMLAITKIICDRIHTLNAVGHFLEG